MTTSTALPYSPSFGARSNRYIAATEASESEYATRSPCLAQELAEIVDLPEVATALEITEEYALGSSAGDEIGFGVELDSAIATGSPRTHDRLIKTCRHALDGLDVDLLGSVIFRFLAWGDCFALYETDNQDRLAITLRPTWQVFLEPDLYTGKVAKAFQLPYGSTERYELPLENLIHWKWRGRHLYGRSLFYSCREDGEALREASGDLRTATRQSAIRPRLHTMPAGSDSLYKTAYRNDHENRMRSGVVTDYYLDHGQGVEVPSGEGGLSELILSADWRRNRIALRSRVPLYLLGIQHQGGQELSMQPAMSFVQHVGHVRQRLSYGLRQALDAYLLAHGFKPPFPYRFVFPNIVVNPWTSPDPDLKTPGVDDSD